MQRIGRAVHGDLTLLHGLQQGGLGFAARPVDFIAQQQVGVVQRTGMIGKAAALPVVHGEAHQVGRQHVRGELHALVGKAHRPADGHGQGGFAHARHIIQQDMTVRQQGGQDLRDRLPLACDDLFNFCEHLFHFRTHDFLL